MEICMKEGSSMYSLVSESSEYCIICYNLIANTSKTFMPCLHSVCKTCLLSYYNTYSFTLQMSEFKCPMPSCDANILKSMSLLLNRSDYTKLKARVNKFKFLKDPTVIWCPTINCEGYGRKNGSEGVRCNYCNISLVNSSFCDDDDIKGFSIVRCPGCKSRISRVFGCMVVSCYCDTEFCTKCLSMDMYAHSNWRCLGVDKKTGELSLSIIFYCIFIYAFLPFLPIIAIYWYKKCWDNEFSPFLSVHKKIAYFILTIFSPVFLILSFFYLPLVWGWLCVDSIFDFRSVKHSHFWIIFRSLIYIPAFFFTFLGWLLLFALLLTFTPLYGIYLLTLYILTFLTILKPS